MWPRRGEVSYLLHGAFYRLAYVETGNPAAPPVLCVHDLTRTGRDFDPLAEALSDQFRLILPDLPGRGGSDWLPDAALYHPATYVQALSYLLAVIEKPVAWLGTGLGGVCGMVVAASPRQRLTRLVLNDAGPLIPAAGQARVRDSFRQQSVFADMAALERRLRALHNGFGRLSDAQWAHLARYSARRLPDGRISFHYDPAIARAILEHETTDQDLWAFWARVQIPRLVLRGDRSDMLEAATVARMQQSGAHALVVPEAGHAPALMDAPTIAAVRAFLRGP
jgi:pimeloyl-ACP methyl ester carboxylesterase